MEGRFLCAVASTNVSWSKSGAKRDLCASGGADAGVARRGSAAVSVVLEAANAWVVEVVRYRILRLSAIGMSWVVVVDHDRFPVGESLAPGCLESYREGS